MISHLKGLLAQKAADRVVIDVHGVGYEVFIPFSTYYELGGIGETVSLHIYTHVREDALCLYGFISPREKSLFTRLIQISGIGPKLGVTILSGLPVEEVVAAIRDGDLGRLSTVPGVGKKTAERIILELKEKILTLFPEVRGPEAVIPAGSAQADVVSALVNLGYARPAAEKSVSQAVREGGAERFEDLLKKALKKLSA
ncbi:MAG: Holliday junction branch migration protein RuvA [Acidobacteria bacterium]|nr:Holliday junction branch migration protein RuvA [Acidobacteriota bacterium]